MNFDYLAIVRATPYLLEGMAFTIELTLVALCGGLIIGTLMAIIRQTKVPVLSQVVRAYITITRSIPLIMVLFWFFFLVPLLLQKISESGHPMPLGPKFTAFLTFTLFESAFYAEIVRAGLRSIDKGQYEAAKALGLSLPVTYAFVVIPQVLRATAPIIVTQTIILFQDTSLVYVLSLTDFLGAAAKIAQRDGKLVEFYTTVAIVYFVLCSIGSEIAERLRAGNGQRRVRSNASGKRSRRAVSFSRM
ncbi:amino acid ABC transporter permease [Pandoraea anhela]|uniref:Glutamate/aspartate import permease protein GltK n=1 Tax=Pandoraea anhela TaxID=2508295 RepID=A0A5E4WED1_9BURK|nr:amino acid ABC transporter permease [Pandoraea anhela]VVE22119.1 amino acid ABC transporter permease [Pandoraea anhela]